MPGLAQEGEPFSEEATLFTKELVLQREVRPGPGTRGAGGIQGDPGIQGDLRAAAGRDRRVRRYPEILGILRHPRGYKEYPVEYGEIPGDSEGSKDSLRDPRGY